MLVDINLLPKKEKTFSTTIILFIFLFLLFVGTGSWIGTDYYETSIQLDQKERILEQEKIFVQAQQQKLQKQSKPALSSAPLLEKVEYVRSKEIEAVDLLQHLVALLPERGYFMKYEYKDRSTITIEARFDTLAEASHYLYELTNSRYLTNASIEKMETTNFEELAADEGLNLFEDYLPRYHAQYMIKFNKDNLQDLSGVE
jgi:type IV pilus assembly protein PilN